MQRITRIGVLSLGRVAGAWGAVLGVFAGIAYALFFSSRGLVGLSHERADALPFAFLALIALFGTPILLGIAYFALGVVSALVLNVVFRLSGGLEVRIERQNN
jgi:hypothetical protein